MAEKIISKVCSKCQIEKCIASFSKSRRAKDGLQSKCTDCVRQYNLEHKQYHATWTKQYYEKNKELICKNTRQYKKDNRDKVKKRNRIYILTYCQTEKYKVSHRESERKRKAIKRGAKRIESFSSKEVFDRDGYVCQLCGKKTRPDFKNTSHPLYPNLDHIVPLSLGGGHTRMNTQCLCHQCNIEKYNNGTGDQLRMF
jgi:5-methylcytosine-specific restriction endonuclease McrA